MLGLGYKDYYYVLKFIWKIGPQLGVFETTGLKQLLFLRFALSGTGDAEITLNLFFIFLSKTVLADLALQCWWKTTTNSSLSGKGFWVILVQNIHGYTLGTNYSKCTIIWDMPFLDILFWMGLYSNCAHISTLDLLFALIPWFISPPTNFTPIFSCGLHLFCLWHLFIIYEEPSSTKAYNSEWSLSTVSGWPPWLTPLAQVSDGKSYSYPLLSHIPIQRPSQYLTDRWFLIRCDSCLGIKDMWNLDSRDLLCHNKCIIML